MKLFVLHGIQQTSMSIIAREAKTGMGAIYNYFSSKEELINAIFLEIKQDEARFIYEGYEENGTVKERFDHLHTRMVHYYLDHPVRFDFINAYYFSPVIRKEVKIENRRLLNRLYRVFSDGMKRMVIKRLPEDELMTVMIGTLSGFLGWKRLLQEEIDQKKINHLTLMTWDALRI